MSSVDVLLTVGKLDASLALLTTQDHHVIEFPTVLLPENVKSWIYHKNASFTKFRGGKKTKESF